MFKESCCLKWSCSLLELFSSFLLCSPGSNRDTAVEQTHLSPGPPLPLACRLDSVLPPTSTSSDCSCAKAASSQLKEDQEMKAEWSEDAMIESEWGWRKWEQNKEKIQIKRRQAKRRWKGEEAQLQHRPINNRFQIWVENAPTNRLITEGNAKSFSVIQMNTFIKQSLRVSSWVWRTKYTLVFSYIHSTFVSMYADVVTAVYCLIYLFSRTNRFLKSEFQLSWATKTRFLFASTVALKRFIDKSITIN